ncbi:MAG TPA: hypothetical protein VFO38_05045 [Candidatus Saccharimonadales bacterium]|nr:hypothetical protein [Candidatus Saccharimonadales bacterium]
MSRKQKKRNKPYTGADAAPTKPNVHRYVAVQRSPLGEWWHTHKQTVKIVAIIVGAIFVVSFLVVELFRLVF